MKKILASSITVLLIGFLLIGVAEFPKFGAEDSPAYNEVANTYVYESLEETGAINIVASMILDYRAFDTFIESSVIFTSLITVIAVLRRGGTKFED